MRHRFIKKLMPLTHKMKSMDLKFFLLGLLLAIQLCAVIAGRPIWPFHHLDMFAKPLVVPDLKPVFVTAEKKELVMDETGISPYSWWEFRHLIVKKYYEGPEVLSHFLNIFLDYKKTKFPDQKFVGIRVYRDCPGNCRLMASSGGFR